MIPIAAMTPHAGTRDKCSFSCTVAIGASYKLISDVIPARNTAAKKMIAMMAGTMVAATAMMSVGNLSYAEEESYTIGISQFAEHGSLDNCREGFLEGLKEEGIEEGKNLTIRINNAAADMGTASQIAQSFVADDVDLIISITTPATQVAMSETSDIPIVFSAVTDPVASEVVKDLDNPGGNVTGTSDAISVDQIMELAEEATPGYKTIGALYNSSETNSVSVVDELKAYAKEKGYKVEDAAITSANEIQPAAQSLAKKCDIVFSPIDNTVASSIATANDVFIKNKIPFYVAADSMVKDGALATCGINYEDLGKETAKMAVEIIKGGDPAKMPVKTMTDCDVYINSDTAKSLGITIPDDVLKKAVDLAKEDL